MPDDTTWEEAKRQLIVIVRQFTVEERAWTAMKQLSRDSKVIIDFEVETEKLKKKAYPGQENTATQQAMEMFIHSLELKLMLEVQKLDYHTLNDIITAAIRIEQLLSYMDSLVSSLQVELRVFQREIKESAAAVVENVAHMAKPPAAPPAVKSRYLDPPPRVSARQCPGKCFLCDQECHLVASCHIQAEIVSVYVAK